MGYVVNSLIFCSILFCINHRISIKCSSLHSYEHTIIGAGANISTMSLNFATLFVYFLGVFVLLFLHRRFFFRKTLINFPFIGCHCIDIKSVVPSTINTHKSTHTQGHLHVTYIHTHIHLQNRHILTGFL